MQIVSKAGDTVDYLVWRHYGSTGNRIVERVLMHNAGLADHGPVLPEGVRIELPALPLPAQKAGLRLWD